jgi:hypothetical protein
MMLVSSENQTIGAEKFPWHSSFFRPSDDSKRTRTQIR